eukprot:12794269-Alexandrium_andersonii.AAC.1
MQRRIGLRQRQGVDTAWGARRATVLLADALQELHEWGVRGRPMPTRDAGRWELPEAWPTDAGFADLHGI